MQNNRLEKYVRALKGGDKNAFDTIYDSTHKPVFFAIYYILKDKTKSEDILQDTYISAYRKIDLYEDCTNFLSWLITIGKRLAINEYNRHGKEIAFDIEDSENLFGKYEDSYDSGIIQTARDILPEDEFKILMLCEVCGYKRRELSEMTGIPISTVSWKYKQAIAKLKSKLDGVQYDG